MSSPAREHVVVAITTFKRPVLLERLLNLVLEIAQDESMKLDISVLVVDNDPAETGRPIAALRPGVRYIAEHKPGIASARQRAVDEVDDGSLLVFLDDDVLPERGWIIPLVSTWKRCSATIVAGYVRYSYPDDTDPWVIDGGFMRRDTRPTGTLLGAAAAGNMLVDVGRVRQLGIEFDRTLGFSGGEDTLFTKQVVRAGGTIVWCQESVVDDFIPLERTTREFCRSRARSHGSTSVLVDLRLASSNAERFSARVKGLGGGLLRVGWGLLRSSAGKLTAETGQIAGGVRIAARGYGMVGAAVGIQSNEYSR